MILLFKELKPKATYGKAKILRQEIISEAESSLEIENLSTRIDTIIELISDKLEIIQKMENEEVIRTNRFGKILKPSTCH